MLKRMLNCPERITYHRLSEVCARRSAQVYAKVRLADVLPIEGSGLSQGLFEFSLQAHYDFVITDLAQNPLFAVEFDGPGHGKPAQVGRDAKKDELSRRFDLPLLRVFGDDLRRSEWKLDRLTEATERWFDARAIELNDRLAVGDGPATPIGRGIKVAETALCPVCKSGMVVKDGKYGPFLSCTRFPDCRGSCDLPGPSILLRPHVDKVHWPTANRQPRPWLIAGVVVIALVLMSLLIIIARSSTDRHQASELAPSIAGADSATARQRNLLGQLIKRRGWGTEERDAETGRVLGYNRLHSELSKKEASKLITAWDDRGK